MNTSKLLNALLLATTAFCATAQVPKEKQPEFVGTGAVVTFDELCLKTYADFNKANVWMNAHAAQENTTKAADPYREEATDRVFLVGSDLATFVVSFANENRCTVYGVGVDKATVERVLAKYMARYADAWKTKFEQFPQEGKEHEKVVQYVANIPGTDKPILMLLVSYISPKGESTHLVKISGMSLQRLQTFKTQKGQQQRP